MVGRRYPFRRLSKQVEMYYDSKFILLYMGGSNVCVLAYKCWGGDRLIQNARLFIWLLLVVQSKKVQLKKGPRGRMDVGSIKNRFLFMCSTLIE